MKKYTTWYVMWNAALKSITVELILQLPVNPQLHLKLAELNDSVKTISLFHFGLNFTIRPYLPQCSEAQFIRLLTGQNVRYFLGAVWDGLVTSVVDHIKKWRFYFCLTQCVVMWGATRHSCAQKTDYWNAKNISSLEKRITKHG